MTIWQARCKQLVYSAWTCPGPISYPAYSWDITRAPAKQEWCIQHLVLDTTMWMPQPWAFKNEKPTDDSGYVVFELSKCWCIVVILVGWSWWRCRRGRRAKLLWHVTPSSFCSLCCYCLPVSSLHCFGNFHLLVSNGTLLLLIAVFVTCLLWFCNDS